MNTLQKIGIILMTATLSSACEEPSADLNQGDEKQEPAIERLASTPPSSGYFFVSRDMRKCMSPMCGGYFLSEVNRSFMRCPDGKVQKSCYIAEGDFGKLNLSQSDIDKLLSRVDKKLVVFHGKIESKVVGNYGRLVADKAFSAVTDAIPLSRDSYSIAYDNGMRCFMAPCPSLDYVHLNSKSPSSSVIDVDFSKVEGINETQIEAAQQAMQLFQDGLVMTAHKELAKEYTMRRVYRLVAHQVFLPVTSAGIDPLYCENDSDCVMTKYGKAVNRPADCYCAMCPTSLANVWTAAEYEANWHNYCDEWKQTCPMGKCVEPPYTACENNTCVSPSAVCTFGMDQTCNDSPIISSIHGSCNNDGICTCYDGFEKNPNTGKCL